jgi:hypothetical protein
LKDDDDDDDDDNDDDMSVYQSLQINLIVTYITISTSKRARQKFPLGRFDLKKLDDVEVKEKYQADLQL